ncbi:helix-turn-helix transcriptional regulator [Actinomycetospora chiangmaiensis]|uniref:helix-turn-helix transcriptional regulator n=1 Tax=Actinomycetospora chiangmaiensis TaxID=402650 RepID=UPI000360028D|nr:AAA family ATPase [Actinomycetospora chiangmaiensis]
MGRGAEIAQLHEVLDRVRRGRAVRLLLTGESGVGTTTLVDTFCDQVAAGPDGPVVVRTVAPEPTGAPVAHATTELLARALDDVVAPGRPTSGRSALALHDVLAVARRSAGPRRPVVLALHDLHHVDPASATVLADLLRRLHGGGLLVLATATDPSRLAVRGRAWWPRLFADGGPGGTTLVGTPTEVRTIPVGGLDAAAVAAFVATRRPAAPTPGPGVAAQLVAATGGHPVHLALLLRTLPDEVLAGLEPLPGRRSLAAPVGEAVASLAPGTRDLVAALAVVGGTAPVSLLEQVAAVAPGSTPPAAPAEAAAAGLVLVAARGPRVELRFVHPLIRDAVYRGLTPAEAAALHCTAAAAIGGRTGFAHAVASAAGSPAPEVADALVAAAAAENDPDESATLLLWAAEVAAGGVEREGLLLEAAVRLVLAGSLGRLRGLESALRGARACGARDLALGTLAFETGDPDAYAPLAAALEDADADPTVRALAALKLGAHHVLHGRGARAVEVAAHIGDLTDDPGFLEGARALEVVGSALRWGPDTALDVLGDHLDGVYGPDLLVICGRLHLAAGDPVAAYHRLHQGLDRIRAGSATTMGRLVHLFLAEAAFRTGRWDEAEAEARVGATVAQEAGSAWIAPAARGMWSMVRAARGGLGDVEVDLDGARRRLERAPNVLGAFTRDLAEAFVAQVRGDADRAYRVLSDLADGPVPALEAAPLALWRVLLAEAAIDADRPATAGAVLQGFPAAGTPLWFALSRYRLLGRLADRSGDAARAREHFRAGLDLAAAREVEALVCPIEVAALHAAAGRLARRQGWASAPEHLAAARRGFAALGGSPWVARVDAEIDLGVPGVTSSAAPAPTVPEPRATTGTELRPAARGVPDTLPAASASAPDEAVVDAASVASLTPREREVVRLVAQGLTSREVAAALYVTPKAISYHLGNVFAKLGVSSRRQLWGRTFD